LLIKQLLIVTLSIALVTLALILGWPAEAQSVPMAEAKELAVETFDARITRLAREYGQNEALARRIIKCESKTDQAARGHLAYIGVDVGLWQINSHFHEDAALALGYDIYRMEDNLEYGFRLLKAEGTRPWKSSAYCWDVA